MSQDAARARQEAEAPEALASPQDAAKARVLAAKREIAEFRAQLAAQGGDAGPSFRRAPDSKRRKAVKREKQRQRARLSASTDDAARDTNHAIAH